MEPECSDRVEEPQCSSEVEPECSGSVEPEGTDVVSENIRIIFHYHNRKNIDKFKMFTHFKHFILYFGINIKTDVDILSLKCGLMPQQ